MSLTNVSKSGELIISGSKSFKDYCPEGTESFELLKESFRNVNYPRCGLQIRVNHWKSHQPHILLYTNDKYKQMT